MSKPSRTPLTAALLAAALVTLAACSGSSEPSGDPSASPTSASPSPSAQPVAVETCPLTGLPPQKGQKINRVALAVKIDNVDIARPQAGLDRADIVIEETVEGGLTRLMAIFQCDSADNIGPIRSARTSDGDLLRLLDGAVFGYSGANPKAIAPVRNTSRAVLIAFDDSPQYFRRDPGRSMPHDVMSSTDAILKAGIARNHKLDAPRTIFSYGDPKRPGKKVRTASLSWSSYTSAVWSWNGHGWARTQNGSPDKLANGKRVVATNVVIMSITTRSSGLHDVLGNASPDDVVTGKGKVWVLRDGKVITGHWKRANRAKRMILRDNAGHVLPLHPGRTWVELLPRPRTPSLS
jgi:hypothetical protein